jgi:transposase InsO family protein
VPIVTDITEHPTAVGKLCLCAIKEVRSNRIVGYAVGLRMTARLAAAAVRAALARRRPAGIMIVYSHRGCGAWPRPG